ncbi:hypothetical protein BU14_0207s0034 [Porphyra umbilicalis]|uniref:Homologous-pairing protein 2 homolog n=1 Tax=Porphyra umbilicalis TaxID=2786 RepID=A0A1X6P5T2_PORUM|nr:hypothetical protein BU14_0207s0034 [Porphyra umbilicalis]|eukprot:OSX76116.1 hypothetical protein BU14_0207s0034 [Porphyra umbilicalis]
MPKPTPLQEERLVNEFLVRTNRPQSVTNIVDALQAAPTPLKKAAVDRATASLVARGDVTLKEYGKAKVFITNQSTIDVPSPEERAAIDERLAQLEAAAVDGQAAVASANAAAADVYATLSDADALARSTEVKVQRSELEAKVASFGGGVVLSEEERAALEQKYAEVMDTWKKRKRIVVEAVATISEGANKKPAELYEKIGIETDEEAGVNMKDMPPALKPERKGRKRGRGT